MATDSSTLIIVHFPAHKGKGLMGPKWSTFRQSVRDLLQQRGILDENSSNDLLTFLYAHPYIALSTLFAALAQAKKQVGWRKGAAPVHLVLHLQRKDKDLLALQDPAADLWDVLHPETVYLTRALKLQWDRFMANKALPRHAFAAEEKGLYELKISDRSAFRTERLFPHREQALLGKHKECFYCGRSTHKPAACPSKKLTMDLQGLAEAGYQPFSQLAASYKEAFTDQKAMADLLAGGVTPAQLREHPQLQAYIAYYDLFLTYQLRFLWYLAFHPATRWHEIKKERRTEIDSRSFDLGLDCLRVGQYGKADEFLEEGRMRRDGKLFYAKVALAFRALELDRGSDAGTLLEAALSLASLEKERVYAHLLLIRHYALEGDLWKADQISNHAATLFADQPEILYARIQIMVREEFGEKIHKQLQGLVHRHRKFFLTALMDPALLAIQGLVENLLTAEFDAQAQAAGEELAAAETACEELRSWLQAEDPELKENLTVLARIKEQHRRGTYFDVLDVIRKAQALAAACQRLWSDKVDRLLDALDAVATARYNYYIFWKGYPAKPFFSRFIHALALVQRHIEEARTLLAEPSGSKYHEAVAAQEAAEAILAGLKPLFTRMIWVKEMLAGARLFARKLVIAEGAVGLLALALLVVLPGQLPAEQAGVLQELAATPSLRNQGLVIALAFLSPLLALTLTVWDLKKS